MLKIGLVRESNPGPLAPEARIIPLDQRATTDQIVWLLDIYSEAENRLCLSKIRGSSGTRTRDLSHPKRESYHLDQRAKLFLKLFILIWCVGNLTSRRCWREKYDVDVTYLLNFGYIVNLPHFAI